MNYFNTLKKYSSLISGPCSLRGVFNCAVVLALGLAVCDAFAVRSDEAVVPVNAPAADAVKTVVREPGLLQVNAAARASESGIKTVWNSRLGTPSIIRGNDLGRKQSYSHGKGLKLQGGGQYKNDSVAVLDNLSTFFSMKDAEKEMSAERVESDTMGCNHVRVKQKYEGLKVVGGDLIVHFDCNDKVYEVNGEYVPEINLDVNPGISAREAVQIAQNKLSDLNLPAGELTGDPELVVFALESDPVLAYEMYLLHRAGVAEPGLWRFWINANNGEILVYYNNIQHIDLPFSVPDPVTIYGNILDGEGGVHTNVQGQSYNSRYYLSNLNEKWVINNAATINYPDAGTLANRTTDDWLDSDTTEMSAARNFEMIQKYFSQVHGRNSYDDEGAMAVANVHQGENNGTEMVNAYWHPYYQQFFFGDGDGKTADSLAVLDVSGHEYTHAVTEHTAALIYYSESGAINESFSDIFGTCVEFFAQDDDTFSYPFTTPGMADWLMGEDCWLSSIALRDMQNPANAFTVGSLGRQATRYKGTYWYFGTGDYGGVHYNNSVQSYFFYLLSEGGFGNNDGIDFDIQGIGITNAEQIAYRALTVYCTPATSYSAARGAWMSAALDFSIEWAIAVSKSWAAVGFPAPPLMQLSSAGALPNGREWAKYSHEIGVLSETTNCVFFLSDGSLPSGLSLNAKTGVISGTPTLAGTSYFDVVVTNYFEAAFTNSYSLEILPVHGAPFAEDFDEIKLSGGVPEFWSQEYVSNKLSWAVSQSLNGSHPAAAYSPTNFMSLFKADYNDNVTRLVSPRIYFSDSARAGRLKFYHYMESWLSTADELKVYYKTAQTNQWELLATYSSNVAGWTERIVDLPEISHQVYVAFEGNAHYGYGIGVDSVSVYDPTPAFGFITSSILPVAIVDESYSTTIRAEGGYLPYTFAVVSNTLPAGLTLTSLSTNAVISGIPTSVCKTNFSIQVTDDHGDTVVKSFSLAVVEPYVTLFTENFEHYGDLPSDWTQEFVDYTVAWEAKSGGYDGIPARAQEGLYNARLFTSRMDGDRVTRLVTPGIDLGQAPENITLYFWHCMAEYDGDLDGLRVLYKTSESGSWILLAEYTENTTEWTERSIVLPETSEDFYIAFEGYARFGHGICIDNIRITDESLAPVITTQRTLPDGLIDTGYELQFEAAGGIPPYVWNVTEGTLPAGITFTAGGLLSGTPGVAYQDEFKVAVTGFDGLSSTNSFSLRIRSVPGLPFFEDFEENGKMPVNWTQDLPGSIYKWAIATGTSGTIERRPIVAYSGSYNASFYYQETSGMKVRLITPMLDLGGVTNGVLKFQHYMEQWLGDQDELKIYSRTAIDGAWTLLATFADNTSSWTERTVALPDGSSTFYIAFEGYAKYGHGICVDDVSITGDYPLGPYGDWLQVNFSSLDISNGVKTAYLSDPDGDKIANIWEYAFYLDPNVQNSSGTPTGGVANTFLQLIYRQNKSADNLTFVVESTTNLVEGVWSTNDISELTRVDNGGWWDVVSQHDIPVTNAPIRFMRLKLLVD